MRIWDEWQKSAISFITAICIQLIHWFLWSHVCCKFCWDLCIVFLSWQRSMGFVEDFEMQINCSFIRWGHQQWWRDMYINMLCSPRKWIMLWQYSSDDMPLLATTMQMNITLYDYNCKRYERQIMLSLNVGELYKIMNRKWYNSWHQCSLEHIEIMDI